MRRARFLAILSAVAVVALMAIPAPSWCAWSDDPAHATRICEGLPQPAFHTTASDGGRGAFVAWYTSEYEYGPATSYVRHINWSGDLDSIRTIGALHLVGGLASDGAQGAFAVSQYRGASGGTHIYAFHLLGDGRLDPSWPGGGVIVCDALYKQGLPRIVSDGARGAIAVWDDFRGGPTGKDVYAAHIDIDGRVNPGPPYMGHRICGAVGGQIDVAAVSDALGGAFVTWYDYRAGETDVYVHHVLPDGSADPAWPSDGVSVCTLPGDQNPSALASDRAGGVFVMWEDWSGSQQQVYVHHIIGTGMKDPAWLPQGMQLTDDAGLARALVADGSGGAFAIWRAYCVSVNHLAAHGAVDGTASSDGSGCIVNTSQDDVAATSDGGDGIIVVWGDLRNGWQELYAQHVIGRDSVDQSWPTYGDLIASDDDDKSVPLSVSDGAGGSIVVWRTSPVYGSYGLAVARTGASVNVGVGHEGNGSLSMWPNPVVSYLVMTWNASDMHGQIDIYDMQGRHIRRLESAIGESENGRVMWDIRDESGVRVKVGIYLVRFGAAGMVGRVVVVR